MEYKLDSYVLSSELKEAVEVSDITQRQLLLRGEPGTGKTLLAEHLAKERGNSVVLIDKIDKTDIEFPNDLLLELDRMDTRIIYVGDAWIAPYQLFSPSINPYSYY